MPSTQVLIVEKVGTIKSLKLKEFVVEDLYKKAGFKSGEGFKLATTWNTVLPDKSSYSVSLYGKTAGRAGQENKYDFPPPVDSTLFFGNCVLVLNSTKDSESTKDLSTDLWFKIYEHLFGGFEDIGSNDSDDEESEEDDDILRTKDGYAKDGFVVDSNEDEDGDEEEDEDEEDDIIEEIVPVITKKVRAKFDCKTTKVKVPRKKSVFDTIETVVAQDIPANFLDCSDELVEEEYL